MRCSHSLFHPIFICCIVLGLFTVGGRLAAQAPVRKTVLKINPLSLFVATGNVKLERRLNERFSAQLGVYVGSPRLEFKTDSTTRSVKYFYIGIIPELRYHIAFSNVPNPKGLFVATFAKYAYVREHYVAHAQTAGGLAKAGVLERNQVFSFGFLLGYQLLIKDRLTLEAYIGPQYSTSHSRRTFTCPTCNGSERPIDRPGLKFDGIDPRFGITVGYAF